MPTFIRLWHQHFYIIANDLWKHLSEMLFFRYFPPKNSSIEQLFNDFLKKTSEKIAIPYKHFLKKGKSIEENQK